MRGSASLHLSCLLFARSCLFFFFFFWVGERPSSAVDLSGKLHERQLAEQHRGPDLFWRSNLKGVSDQKASPRGSRLVTTGEKPGSVPTRERCAEILLFLQPSRSETSLLDAVAFRGA